MPEGKVPTFKAPPGLLPLTPPKTVVDGLKKGCRCAVFCSSRGQQLPWVGERAMSIGGGGIGGAIIGAERNRVSRERDSDTVRAEGTSRHRKKGSKGGPKVSDSGQ
jgi:hypothetical protein